MSLLLSCYPALLPSVGSNRPLEAKVGLIQVGGLQVAGGGLALCARCTSFRVDGCSDQAIYMMSEFEDVKISHDKWFVRARQIKHIETIIGGMQCTMTAADSLNTVRLRIRTNDWKHAMYNEFEETSGRVKHSYKSCLHSNK